jgi:two-component system sensor histidine kinase MprB
VSLRARMAGAAGLAVAAAVISAALIVYVAVRSELRGEIDRALRVQAESFLRPPPDGPGRQGVRRPGEPNGRPPPGRGAPGPPPFGGPRGYFQFVARDGQVSLSPDESTRLPVPAQVRALAATGSGSYAADARVAGIHLRVLSAGIGPRGAVQLARPLSEVDHELSRILLILAIVAVAGIALAAGLGAVVARTALAPIARFTRRTEKLAATPDLSQRMEVTGRDELARLSRSFNATLEALERSVDAQRHLVADASHELRTPIASLRANIQVLEDADRLPEHELASLRADIVDELDELTALVSDVVELARGADARRELDDVRLDEIVKPLVERARRRSGGGPTFRVALEPTLVRGEPDRISRAVSNLLDNARKWSPAEGVVEVGLAAGTLTVRDHGPGFPPTALPHVFDRFFRADEARSMPGSGLGLAIVRQAAEAHGGTVQAANAPDGGAVVRVSFGPPVPIASAELPT